MLRLATADDFGFVRSLVQRSENIPYLTDEDDEALALYLSDPASQMLIWGTDRPRGFAIFCGVGQPSGTVELMRLALDEPGLGEGAVFIRALIDHAFLALKARRLWLDATGENLRAQRVYIREGFTLEGRLRQHHYRPATERIVDVLLYGMLRDEWSTLPA